MSSDAEKLQQELDAARRELEEARAVIAAIRRGEADALVIETDGGPKVYTLRTADQPYRTIVETLKEGAVTITADGMILYCNEAFARLVSRDASLLIGSNFVEIAGAGDDRGAYCRGREGRPRMRARLRSRPQARMPGLVDAAPSRRIDDLVSARHGPHRPGIAAPVQRHRRVH